MNKLKVAFVFPYPLNGAPSQRFRFAQYLHFLPEAGIDYDCFSYLSDRAWENLYKPGNFFRKFLSIARGYLNRLILLRKLRKYDFIFLHREAAPLGPPLLEFILVSILGKKLIYDFDDAIWLPNFSESNKFFSFLKWYSNTRYICRRAYKISCGNEYLCNFARQYNKNVIYNPTTIDTEGYHNRVKDHYAGNIVVGWTGSHSTVRYLYELSPVIKKLNQKHQFIFMVIADISPDFDLPNFKFVKWKKESEIEDLLKLNIGLMPLEDDKWAKGKCGFKALQYMALGIPALVSPVGVNTRIVDDGINGFICKTQEEWYNALDRLLSDPDLLKEMGKKTRDKIEKYYSVNSNKDNFIALFT